MGDLIDRGPESYQVVELVKENEYHCLMGNHELMLLNIFTTPKISTSGVNVWVHGGGQATVASYPQPAIPKTHL